MALVHRDASLVFLRMSVLPFHHATNLAFRPACSHSTEQEQPADSPIEESSLRIFSSNLLIPALSVSLSRRGPVDQPAGGRRFREPADPAHIVSGRPAVLDCPPVAMQRGCQRLVVEGQSGRDGGGGGGCPASAFGRKSLPCCVPCCCLPSARLFLCAAVVWSSAPVSALRLDVTRNSN